MLQILKIPLFLLPPSNKSPRIPQQGSPSPSPSPSSFQTYIPNLKILFRILNLNPTSSLREVRRAYYLLARKYQPDKWNEDSSKHLKAESKERLKSILNTFEDLKLANYLA